MHRADVPDIRAKELLTVVTLAEYGSFVAAAAHLKTSQPALTRTVKRVERVLGVTLFARNTRRVEITPAGREFVAVAERMLDDLQLTVRNLDEVTREQRGRVTVSTYSAFAVNPMPYLVRDYRETRPLVEVRIREGRQFDILEDVRSGVADFGIGYVNSLPDLMESTLLRKESLYAVVPGSHPLASSKRTKISLRELRDEAARVRTDGKLPAAARRRRRGRVWFQPALRGHRRSPAERAPPRLRRCRHRRAARRVPAADAVGRRFPADAAVGPAALGFGRADHPARPLSHAGRRPDCCR